MCVTYLIKEDLMSTSKRPGVRRTTVEIHANEPGFMVSPGKQGCHPKWENQWEPISFPDPIRKTQGGAGKRGREQNLQALCLGPEISLNT